MSDGLTPRVLLDTPNRYFDGIVNVVNRYEGTVNTYDGDTIVVIWGAPLRVADQARKAVQAALETQRWIVASRLTSSDIARRDQVAVSAETLAELGPDVIAVDLGAVQVKGRAEAVRCHQVNRVGTIESPNPPPAPERPIGAAAVAGYQ